ncbi:hypothetical protein GQ57_21935 [Burkholderia sp. MSh2]|uniref:Lipoprotein n=1 Tax=Burkholderia paludis TaxID=1506587 RepID=A0A6P2RMV8_9BURK|nr:MULTISPECIES: hypothetical protein [Burkholderia]KEZ03907.1 hypothetical protein GQ57_21935 [Burkholderia sp. MSh2]KFG95838.1 hypothetical protein GQ56_0118010 [Burkholderia paludis]CAB3773599.1 hypothetical protein LMG30113_07209 [Burkholderia paludis]VWC38199.1 hypothetical protein BPA30113_06716 [Burkholderia paludis]
MRKLLSLSFGAVTIVLAAVGPPAPACADESAPPDRAMLLAANAPSMQRGNDAGIVTVSAPLSAGRSSVTLWDEIPPPLLPTPTPLPAPQPGNVQHVTEEHAQGSARQ